MTSAEGQATAFFILYFLQSEFSSEKATLLKVSKSTGPGRLMGQVGSPCLTKKTKPKAVENLHHVYISITVCSSPFAALGIPFQLWLHFTFLGSTHSKFLETLCTLQSTGHKYHVMFCLPRCPTKFTFYQFREGCCGQRECMCAPVPHYQQQSLSGWKESLAVWESGFCAFPKCFQDLARVVSPSHNTLEAWGDHQFPFTLNKLFPYQGRRLGKE